jgi:hypothetical protein
MFSGRTAEFDEADTFLDAARASSDGYTLARALAYVGILWYVRGNIERCHTLAEEAIPLARQTGNPALIANVGLYLGGALEASDPARARSVLETALQHANTVDLTYVIVPCVAWLGRMGTDVLANPKWATHLRTALAASYEAGDTRTTLYHLDLHAQALADTDRAEAAAKLAAAVAEMSLHVLNPISIAHQRTTNQRLLAGSAPSASPSSPPRAQPSPTTNS